MTAMRLKRYQSPSGGFALGKMGVGATMLKQGKTARDYVQSGLVAMWDGIENAGWGQHNASATTWKDLVGNRDWTLASDAVVGSDFIGRNSAPNSAFASFQSAFTDYVASEIVLKKTGGRDVLFFGDQSHGFSYTYNGNPCWFNGSQSKEYSNTYSSNSRVSFAIDLNTLTCYANGEQVSVVNYGYYRGTGDVSYLGYALNGAGWAGEVCAIRLYSRALTADEIAANYAIDKERFNLP